MRTLLADGAWRCAFSLLRRTRRRGMQTRYINYDPYLHQGAYVSRPLSGWVVAVRVPCDGYDEPSAFDLADEAALEFRERAELLEWRFVLFAAEGGEHAGEVADRGDSGAEASADRFAGGGASEVVVAPAGAGRLGDDLQLPCVRPELEHRLPGETLVEVRPLAVREAGVEVVERKLKPAKVLGPQRGRDVEPVGEFLSALDDAGEAPDQDVGDALALE